MASYLRPSPSTWGLSAEAKLIDSHILDAQGRRRSLEEVGAEVGDMQAFLGLMELELRTRLRRPHARGYPPRIFMSYRRATPEDIAWCVQLADALTANGFDVLIDERVVGSLAAASLSEELAQFLALMADADIALIVVSSPYLTGGEPNSMATWIFEEWHRLEILSVWGLLETVVVHRSGDIDGGSSFFGRPGASDAYIDLRADPDDMAPVLEFFGAYSGLRMDPHDRERLGQKAAEAIAAARVPGASDRARDAVAAIGDLRGTEEWGVAAAHACAAAGDRAGARALALQTLAQNPTLPSAFLLAYVLWLTDHDLEAFRELAAQSESRSLWRHQMKVIMADILKRFDQPIAAMNQYRWCLTAKDQPELGGRWSQFSAEGDAECQQLVNALDEIVGPFPGVTCSACSARYPEGWLACAHCGTTRPPGQPCGMCASDPPVMQDLGSLGFCPVCRRSTGPVPQNMLIVPREPKGRFSVLASSAARR
jgi:hypothetical protein